MAFDDIGNGAVGVVANTPGTAGTALTFSTGQGNNFPTLVNGFNALVIAGPTIIPQAGQANFEIIRITALSGDNATITRAQENTTAIDIQPGYYVFAGLTRKMIEDIISNFANYQPLAANLTTYASKIPPAGNVVGDSDTQTLTSKTLTSPTVTSPTTTGTDTGVETLTHKTITDSTNTIGPVTTTAKAKATISALTPITNATWTKVPLNTIIYNPGSNFDNVTNYRFTAPVAGKYLVSAAIQWASATNQADSWIGIYKNGSQYSAVETYMNTANRQSAFISDIIDLAAGDYIELWCYQSSGVTLDLTETIASTTFMSVHLLSLN